MTLASVPWRSGRGPSHASVRARPWRGPASSSSSALPLLSGHVTHDPLDTDVSIEAPEHIVFRYVVAGPARRALAQLLDIIVCYGAALVLSILVVLAFAGFAGLRGALGTMIDAGTGIILVVAFAAQWLYSFLWEGMTGQSPGKMALDLRVVMIDGRPIGFGAAALRNVLRAADVLPGGYLVGVTTMALNQRFQRLGDFVAGTMVIVAGRPHKTAPLALWPPPLPVELAVLPDVVPLDVDERAAIELFLRRKALLGAARADKARDPPHGAPPAALRVPSPGCLSHARPALRPRRERWTGRGASVVAAHPRDVAARPCIRRAAGDFRRHGGRVRRAAPG